jgi:hypothetical protein
MDGITVQNLFQRSTAAMEIAMRAAHLQPDA